MRLSKEPSRRVPVLSPCAEETSIFVAATKNRPDILKFQKVRNSVLSVVNKFPALSLPLCALDLTTIVHPFSGRTEEDGCHRQDEQEQYPAHGGRITHPEKLESISV
jgi:hypothetical protein